MNSEYQTPPPPIQTLMLGLYGLTEAASMQRVDCIFSGQSPLQPFGFPPVQSEGKTKA